jgi:two-component system nitrogen regulation sensor histidine kinase NtrY
MPSPRTVPTDLAALIENALGLYNGIFTDVTIARQLASGMPIVRIDPEQIRRVIINLVDNAIEAVERRGHIVVATEVDTPNHIVRLVVADDGPGIPAADREKLFLPYYSTKRRGSGLGLAIVRRIIAEHGGNIEASDNTPCGTRFTIELPC